MLQQGSLPKRRAAAVNPDAPNTASRYDAGRSGTAMPSEAFQYNIAYDAFRADSEFWDHWKVVDCARNSPEQSICHGSATIRVVLDLPTSQRLFPTAYTPGFPTLPFSMGDSGNVLVDSLTWVARDRLPLNEGESLVCTDYITDLDDMQVWCEDNPDCVGFAYNETSLEWRPKKAGTGFEHASAEWESRAGGWKFFYIQERAESSTRSVKSIHGLPPGYSVALEVHILEEARIMLGHQRAFRAGKIDPRYEWLDAIVRKVDGNPIAKPEQRAKRLARPKNSGASQQHSRPEADLRPPVGSLSIDCSEPGMSEEVKSYSDLYGDAAQVMKHVALGKNQAYAENSLINAFGADVSLPKPESGSWAGPRQKTAEEIKKERSDGVALDNDLDALLERTADVNKPNRGGLIGNRLDRLA